MTCELVPQDASWDLGGLIYRVVVLDDDIDGYNCCPYCASYCDATIEMRVLIVCLFAARMDHAFVSFFHAHISNLVLKNICL